MRETRPEHMTSDEDTVRRIADTFGHALAEGDFEPYLELLDDDIDFQIASPVRGGIVVMCGRAEVRAYLEEMAKEYTELELVPKEIRELAPGRYLTLGTWHGRVHGGASFGTPLASIIELHDGKAVRMRGFMDEQQALAAADA